VGTGDYRGDDRRRYSEEGVGGGSSWWRTGAAQMGLLVLVGLVLLRVGSVPGMAVWLTSLRGVAIALGAAMAVAGTLYWRTTGAARGLHAAVAAGPITAMVLVDLTGGAGAAAVGEDLRLALGLAAVVWVARSTWGPEVDTRLRPVVEVGAVTLVAVVGVVLAGLITPGLLAAGAGTSLLLAGGWVVPGIAGMRRGAHRNAVFATALAWAAVGMSLAESARFVATIDGTAWLAVSEIARVLALLIAALGAVLAMAGYGRARRSDLYGLELAHRTSQRDRERERRDLDHDIRNALMAIEGSTLTLERRHGQLSDDQATRLYGALHAGVGVLKDRLEHSDRPSDTPDGVMASGRHPIGG
jgi:hypothetical protein